MADNLSKADRKKNMSHIRSTNSRPEEKVRKYLFSKGLRYRKNVRKLPGCFWHKHDCGRFVWPASNQDYWKAKILRNVERDAENTRCLLNAGWKVITVWECELRKDAATSRLERLYCEITNQKAQSL